MLKGLCKLSKKYSTFTYFAPFFQYQYEEITDKTYTDLLVPISSLTTVNSYFGGFGFGCRFSAIGNRFCVNIFAGGGPKYSSLMGAKKYPDLLEVGYTGITPKLELQMGIAF